MDALRTSIDAEKKKAPEPHKGDKRNVRRNVRR
jgi:hypothetical protein